METGLYYSCLGKTNGAGRNKDQIKEAKAKKKIKMEHFIEIEKYLKALNV